MNPALRTALIVRGELHRMVIDGFPQSGEAEKKFEDAFLLLRRPSPLVFRQRMQDALRIGEKPVDCARFEFPLLMTHRERPPCADLGEFEKMAQAELLAGQCRHRPLDATYDAAGSLSRRHRLPLFPPV